LMDQFPYIYAYIDFHCAYGAIVHPWGDDQLQLSNPSMNFMNPVYDHQRDPNSGSYGEYMPPEDLETFRRLGQKFCNALAGVRGASYQVMSAVELAPAPDVDPQSPALWWYSATSGANDDYAYSRHFSDPSKSKILAFTVEFGTPVDNTSDATAVVGFQPAIPQMQWIIQDLIAGTLGFCLEVRASVPSQRSYLLIALLVAVITLLVVSLCTAL
ncbi:MAG TPA: M14 family zinc carboxypeptidase, partial [Polyangiaceae bacterium]|nr:M14 family zinc carboxypeptidase [Polyangiaceae bacterium]